MSHRQRSIGGLAVPPMSLGTMFFGTAVPQSAAFDCLDRADDLGAVWWDTANNYTTMGGGTGDESEATLGAWFASRGARSRDRVVLATKVGARRDPGPGFAGLSTAAIRRQVTASLQRLRTDRIDLLYAHLDDASVPFVESLGAFAALVDDGLVREIGASNLTAARLRESLDAAGPARHRALQQRFSFLDPDPAANFGVQVVLDTATEAVAVVNDVTLLGYSPLLSGAYVRADRPIPPQYRSPANDGALAELGRQADLHDLDAGQLVLAWMINRDVPVIPVVGASCPDHVSSAWEAVTTTLPRAVVAGLDVVRHMAP